MNALFRPSAELAAELHRLQNSFDQTFRPGSNIRALAGASFPVLNVGSTPETVEVMALAPGLDPAAVQLTIDRGLLIISGDRDPLLPQGGQGVSLYAQERYSGPFRRVISLPDDVDPSKVDASYKDGILRVTLSKRETSKPRRIEIAA
jgi:HSP20 family protein